MTGSVYITMDTDWANDGLLAYTAGLAERLNIPVTLFITNDTPMLKVLREHPLFTFGIHPNFLPHLNGQTAKTYRQTLEEMLDLVPEAKVLRCHALVDATPILTAAKDLGMLADMNLFIPHSSGIRLSPFRHFSGLKRLPFFYEDDAWASEPGAASPEQHLHTEGLKIFNFHPIHLYLNTESMDRYNRSKPYYHDFECLAPFIKNSPETGALDFLEKLTELVREEGLRFGRISELWE